MVALLVTCFIGILAGQGHVLTPTTLGVVATAALATAAVPLALITIGALATSFLFDGHDDGNPPAKVRLQSPFSLTSALKFGAIFLALQVGDCQKVAAMGDRTLCVLVRRGSYWR